MRTPAEEIDAITASLAVKVRVGDACQRAQILREAAKATTRLADDMASLYAIAVRELVAEVGATEASKKLSLSRNRIYQILKHA